MTDNDSRKPFTEHDDTMTSFSADPSNSQSIPFDIICKIDVRTKGYGKFRDEQRNILRYSYNAKKD